MDEEGGLDDLMVGPPPPDMVEEMDSLPEDARDAEVRRDGLACLHGAA